MSWQGGRQLASMTKGSDTLSFAYNESGLRTSKTVNGVTHSYVWQGSKLAADITDAYALYFHYDSSGEVIGFTRTANGTDTEYFYVKNFQGDILKVITATGTEAAAYTYDAWGKLLTSTGDMADINPLRYRGYFYDTETGLYYLKSRYYAPEVGRFINPDAYASTGQGILGLNMFTYCICSPVTLYDPSGRLTIAAGVDASAAFGLAVGMSLQYVFDLHGNYGVLVTAALGGGTPAASVSYITSITNADTIWDLEGIGISVGGSSFVGADFTVGTARDKSAVFGVQGSLSLVSAEVPIELHGVMTYSFILAEESIPLYLREELREQTIMLYREYMLSTVSKPHTCKRTGLSQIMEVS